MIRLLKCEFRKFRGTYINSLSFLGMIFPVVLTFIVFLIKKDDFIKGNSFNWDNFNTQLTMFFVILLGPIITSFIGVFTVYYEYQQGTIKNVLMAPYGRIPVILTKIIYISLFVLLQYAVVAAIGILSAFLLGFEVTFVKAAEFTRQLLMAGLSTVMLIPLMILIILIFKSFIAPMVATVAGTLSNVLSMNWEKSYLSPFTIPADISFIMAGQMKMDIIYPVISACAYFAVFMAVTLIYFKKADQNV